MALKRTQVDPPLQPIGPVRPPLKVLMLYACGQLGWSLASFAVGNLLVYFYMPPEQGAPVFPLFIYQGAVLGLLTLIGIVSAGGRLLDGVLDPMVANWSDRKQSFLGKRRWFMLWGALPLVLFATLVFFPPDHSESASNFLWLIVVISLYYFFFAMYVIPYNALMAELGHTTQDRLVISMLVSIAWALGFVLGNSAYAWQSMLEGLGQSPLRAFQNALVMLHGVALLFLLLPVFFLDEKRYARQSLSRHGLQEALRVVLGNHHFRWFLFSYLLYWLSMTFIQLGIGYYTTLLLDLDKSMAFQFSLTSFLTSFLLYYPLHQLVNHWGKRRILLAAYGVFGIIFALVSMIKSIPLPAEWLLYGLAIAAAAPMATFGILPNVIVGDEVEKEEGRSGQQLSAMFFGVCAFTMKAGIALANLIFPSLLLLGKSAQNPLGVQCTALAAMVFCFAGWWAMRQYQE